RTEAADRTFEGLDPADRDLPAKVDALLSSLDDTVGDQLVRKVKVLTWLGERRLLACAGARGAAAPARGNNTGLIGGVPMGGAISSCPQAMEVLKMAFQQSEDPTQWEVVPKVCEYFIHQRPDDESLVAYCESPVMRMVKLGQEMGLKQSRKKWDS